MNMEHRLKAALRSLRERTDFVPDVAITLGSGLGGFGKQIELIEQIPYEEIDQLPTCGVEGHRGAYLIGKIRGVNVICMQGRVHYYEGYTSQEAVMPVQLMGMVGAKVWIATNAAGGITYPEIGTLMLISDHICTVPSSLIGKNIDSLGTRFPDMSNAYDPHLRAIARETALQKGIELKEGVYIQMSGPQFETPAEIKMARAIGADAVGMSTAIETIAANHMGMRAMGISCITNPACGIGQEALAHVDVQRAADLSGENLKELIFGSIARMREEGIV